jgi:hypothetical protein
MTNFEENLPARKGPAVLLVLALGLGQTALLHGAIGPHWSNADCGKDARQESITGMSLFQSEPYSIQRWESTSDALDAVDVSSNITASQITEQSDVPGDVGNLKEWKRRVEARYKAARNGGLQIFLPGSWTVGETILVRVLINRAPEGADGLTVPLALAKDTAARFTGLLKVDDEMMVKLSSKEPGSVEIHPDDSQTRSAIRHILPGGRAEWTWRVKASEPGGKHLTVMADVVYRRNFLEYGPPMLIFNSSIAPLSVQVLP